MTEQPTPRELRLSVAEKLALLPANVDANGKSDLDRQADADRFARFTEAQAPMVAELPVQEPMHSNRMQGHSASGANVPASPPSTPLEAVRRQVAKHNIGA